MDGGSRKNCLLSFFVLFFVFLGLNTKMTFVSFKLMGATLQYLVEILKFNVGFKMNHSRTLRKYHTKWTKSMG